MRKKRIVAVLLAAGMILPCTSIILAAIATANKNIIGGADLSTFLFVFSHQNGGIYALLSFFGAVCVIAAAVTGILKKK
jgi:hypothetical protein